MAQYEDEPDAPASNMPDEFGAEKKDDAEYERRELYRDWKHWVECAQKLRKDWEEKWKVERLENYYLGNQSNRSRAPIFNHFGATLKSTQPELFYSNPTFLARPNPGEDPLVGDRKAAVAQSLLAAIAGHEDNLEEAAELGTMQAHFRVGVLKVCYDPRLEPNPNAGMPMFMIDAGGLPQRDPATGEPIPITDPTTGEAQVEPDEIVSDETYRFEWVDAKNMLLPDEGPDMKRWCRIGEEVVVTLEEAKADTRFPPELREQLKANESKEPSKRPSDDDGRESRYGDKMFRYFECYDIKKKRWCIFATGQVFDDFLVEDVFPQGIDNHPYSILRFTPIIGPEPSPWPLPETYGWLDPQTEYNTRRQQITEGSKRSARKIFYADGTFANEDEALKALVSSNDMEAVKINDITKPPVVIPDPNLPSDIFKDIALLQTDWRIITHQTGARQGVSDANTATEAAFAERAANARTADKRKVVTRWLRAAGRKMFQLVRATMTLEMWVKIKGMGDEEIQRFATAQYGIQPEMMAMVPAIKDVLLARFGKETAVKATREMINFEADIDIVPGSIRLRTLDLERRDLLEFAQLIGQFPQLLMSLELMRRFAKHFEFLDDAVVEELYLTAQKMMMAAQATAGRQGENGQGGGPGPTAAENTGTAMANAGTPKEAMQ